MIWQREILRKVKKQMYVRHWCITWLFGRDSPAYAVVVEAALILSKLYVRLPLGEALHPSLLRPRSRWFCPKPFAVCADIFTSLHEFDVWAAIMPESSEGLTAHGGEVSIFVSSFVGRMDSYKRCWCRQVGWGVLCSPLRCSWHRKTVHVCIIFNKWNGMLANRFRECIVRRTANMPCGCGKNTFSEIKCCNRFRWVRPTEYSSVNAALQTS